MKISVIGAGSIGGTLGKAWAAAGHAVQFGVRDANAPKVQRLLDGISGDATAASVESALAYGDVIQIAIPGPAVAEFARTAGAALDGKTVIDASNRMGQAEMNSIGALRAAAPNARFFRAFNNLGWENFAQPQIGSERIDLFYCGDAGEAQRAVHGLIDDVGLNPVYVGGLDKLPLIDMLTLLWASLAHGQGYGRRIGLKLLAP